MLVSAGLIGVVLPGPGAPALVAGGLMLWPGAFGKAERWIATAVPRGPPQGDRPHQPLPVRPGASISRFDRDDRRAAPVGACLKHRDRPRSHDPRPPEAAGIDIPAGLPSSNWRATCNHRSLSPSAPGKRAGGGPLRGGFGPHRSTWWDAKSPDPGGTSSRRRSNERSEATGSSRPVRPCARWRAGAATGERHERTGQRNWKSLVASWISGPTRRPSS